MFTRFKNKNEVAWLNKAESRNVSYVHYVCSVCNEKTVIESSGKLKKNNTSGHTGVYFHKSSKKWRAVGIGKKRPTLGNFVRIEDAIEARRREEARQGFVMGNDG
jgi:predicted nucleotidyltransferase